MKNSIENTNILVNRALLEKKQEEILGNQNQIREKEIKVLQDKTRQYSSRTPPIQGIGLECHETHEFNSNSSSEKYIELLDQDNVLLSQNVVSSNQMKRYPKVKTLLELFLSSKQLAMESFKQFSIQPTRLNFMLSSLFYFIAICTTIERRENGGYLSILLQGKMPGYAALYQNSCWESFENVTEKYVNSVSCSINDIELYKDRALLSLNSPWNKQVQKDFRAFFIEALSTKNQHTTSISETTNHKEARFFLSPWYKIDSCPIPSDFIIATRENSNVFENTFGLVDTRRERDPRECHRYGVSGKNTTFLQSTRSEPRSKTNRIPQVSSARDLSYDRISGLEYIIPCYNSKKRIFLENDSIPSKCKSWHLPSLSDSKGNSTQLYLDKSKASIQDLIPKRSRDLSSVTTVTQVPTKEKHKLKPIGKKLTCYTTSNNRVSRPSEKYLSAFQSILNQYFYIDGLLLINLAETESWRYLLANIAYSIQSKGENKSQATEYLAARKEYELIQNGQVMGSPKIKSTLLRDKLNESNYKSDIELVLNGERVESVNFLKQECRKTDTVFLPEIKPFTNFEKHDSVTRDETSSRPDTEDRSYLRGVRTGENIEIPTTQNNVETRDLGKNKLKTKKEQNLRQSTFIDSLGQVNYTKMYFKKLFSNSFRDNNWDSMRHVSGYKFPDLKAFSITGLFKQFVIRRLFVSSAVFNFAEVWLRPSTAYDLLLAWTKARPSTTTQANLASLIFHCPELINQVLLTPLFFKLPPALPTCYLNNSILSSCLNQHKTINNRLVLPEADDKPKTRAIEPQYFRKAKQQNRETPVIPHSGITESRGPVEISYKAINLPEFKQITKLFNKLGIDYQDYLKQPKDSPFALLISPSLEDDEAIRVEAERKAGQGEKKMTPFQLLQDIRETEKQLEAAKDLRTFSAKNILAYKGLNDNHDYSATRVAEDKSDLKMQFDSSTTPVVQNKLFRMEQFDSSIGRLSRNKKASEFIFSGVENMSSNRKSSFFGEMTLLPKLLAAKDQKEIKEQIVDAKPTRCNFFALQKNTRSQSRDQNEFKQSRLPDLQLRAEKDLIDLIESANLEARNTIGEHNRIFKADVYSSLKGLVGGGDVEKLCFSGCQKRRIASNLFVAPSQQHLLLPQMSLSDWNKILQWQLKTHFFDEQKRLQSLQESNPEKQFKIKKLAIYLPWVTFRTALNQAFEWPLTRLDFSEFVPADRKVKIKYPKSENVEYMIAARNITRGLNPDFLQAQSKSGDASREKTIDKHYLFQATTNQSYLLIYRLFLFFVLKNIFQYVYRISLRKFLIRMAYSDFGLTVTSPEFREWLQNTTPKSVYKVDKPLQSIAGIEQNIVTISQIIWNLRNFGRTRHKIPAVLLLGSTAAEKTSLVQAIASEAKVPVVVQPMEALLTNSISPYEKLEQVFLLARKQAPCILFLDSLDKIGKSRRDVVSNYAGAQDSLFCLDADIAEGKHDFANLSYSLQTRLITNKADASHSNFEKFYLYGDDTLSDSSFFDLAESGQDATQKGDQVGNSSVAFYQEKTESESRRINLLLRLLTEIDGISPLNGVVVMATTEQSATLDPALLRPGRFQTIIKVSLPDSDTRIQLFKVESQKLGCSPYIPWDYLAVRTSNMSGADIISAINHSAIRAILDNTVHTLQTLEHGLNYVSALPNTKKQTLFKNCNDPFHTSRVAFYQAGKVVVQNLLLEYPNDAFFSLESAFLRTDKKNSDASVVQQDFKLESNCISGSDLSSATRVTEQSFESRQPQTQGGSTGSHLENKNTRIFSATTRIHFQTRLIALYAGKAAELLHLDCNTTLSQNVEYIDPFRYFHCKNRTIIVPPSETTEQRNQISILLNLLKTYEFTAKDWQSNLAFSDLLTASSVIHAMIDRWYLYSQKLFTFKSNQVVTSLNYQQMQEQQYFVLFHKLSKQVYSERAKAGFWSNSEDQNKQISQIDQFSAINQIRQERQKISWWNEKICQEVEMLERPYGKWYRLYLPKVEQRERNEEWVPPDLVFHDSRSLSAISKDKSKFLKTLNDLYLVERDSAYYNVVMNCFYKSYNLLNENRELLDLLADHFIRFRILRSPEISKICRLYFR